jgi:hypothetical protein
VARAKAALKQVGGGARRRMAAPALLQPSAQQLLLSLLLLLLLLLAGAAAEEAEGADELYHQLGEPSVVTVVTATTGKAELARCIESVRSQDYRGAIQHIVVVDGERFAPAVRAVVAALEPAAAPPPPYASCPEAPHVKNSPCGAAPGGPEGSGVGPRWLDVVYLPFNMHGDGGRVYAAGPNFARGAYVSNLDEDNYYAPEHIGSLVDLLVEQELDWAYSLRTLAMKGDPLAHDRCESLGFLHEVWDWDGEPNFNAAHSQHHVDTNCYMARRPVALALATQWNCLPRHNDRCYLEAAASAYPSFGTTRSHTVFYDVDPATEKGLAILGFFSEGLRSINERYHSHSGDDDAEGKADGLMPWERPENGGHGAPPPLPLHWACSGFTGDSVPFFCLPSLAASLSAQEGEAALDDGVAEQVAADDGCEEGWTGADCLQCAPGYSGDFCTRDSDGGDSAAAAASAAAASAASAAGSETAEAEAVAKSPAKQSRRKGKGRSRDTKSKRLNDDGESLVIAQRRVRQGEIDSLLTQEQADPSAGAPSLATLHHLAVARAARVLSDDHPSSSSARQQQQGGGQGQEEEEEEEEDQQAAIHIREAIQSLHQLIDAAPTEPAPLSLLSAVLYQRGTGSGASGAAGRRSLAAGGSDGSSAWSLQGVREAVRVLRHARRHNPDDNAIATVYADALKALDHHSWSGVVGGDDPVMASLCSYSTPWQADTRLPLPPAAAAAGGSDGDGQRWKPLVYVFEGGNMLSTWLELSSEPSTAECAASATWVSDLACLSAADAVVFDCPDGTAEQHPTTTLLQAAAASGGGGGGKPRGQLWVLLCGESAGRLPLLTDTVFMSRFDIKVTHQPDADLKFSYVPRRAEIFIESAPRPKTHFANWIASNCVEHRVKRVQDLMAALCPLHSADGGSKDDQADEGGLGACRKVDCLGGCLRNTAWPPEGSLEQLHGSTKIALLARYKFTFAFENSQAEGYVTEKFFQPLIAGSVPVYWGAPDVAGFAPDPRSYINVEDFGTAEELAEYLVYLDRNDTAYEELLEWKTRPLRDDFIGEGGAAHVSASDVIGRVYGEGVQHRNPMGGWDPCRLNNLIRQRIQLSTAAGTGAATSSSGGLVVAGAVSALDGRIAAASRSSSQGVDEQGGSWWMSVSAPGDQTHMFRLTTSLDPLAVVQEYCTRHPCGAANEAALAGAITASQAQAAERAALEQLGTVAGGKQRGRLCVIGSRNEGFFSNVLQAVDGLMLCAAKGLPATVQWTEEDFPYRADDSDADAAGAGAAGELNAWDQFFLPIGPMTPSSDAVQQQQQQQHVTLRDYSRLPRQVPTQFEQYVNSRGDNLHCPGLSDPYDRERVHHAMSRLGVAIQPWVNDTIRQFVAENFHDRVTGERVGLVLGVHHRGTDHWDELPGGALVPFERYLQTVRKVLTAWRRKQQQQQQQDGEQAMAVAVPVVFVASDSKEAVTRLRAELDERDGGSGEAHVVSAAGVVRREQIDDTVAIHRVRGNGRQKGANVLVDALLLAACDEMVHAQSNVALFAAYSNPKLTLHYLGHEQVFGYHEAQAQAQAAAAAPLRFRLSFHAYGGDIEARSQLLWSAARSLGLVGEVGVVDTSTVSGAGSAAATMGFGLGEVVGHVIGRRSAVESFRFKLFTLETLSDSGGGGGEATAVPAWAEAAPIVELHEEADAEAGMVLRGSGADINHCPGVELGDDYEYDFASVADKVVPPPQAVGVRVVAIDVESTAANEQPGAGAAIVAPQITVLRNVLLPMSCEAAVHMGCSAAAASSQQEQEQEESGEWRELEGALQARLAAVLEQVVQAPGGGAVPAGWRLVLDGSVQRYSLFEEGGPSLTTQAAAAAQGSGTVIGKVIVQLSRSHHQGPFVFPYLEELPVPQASSSASSSPSSSSSASSSGRRLVRVNAKKASCDSVCGEAAAAAANEAGVPYCCCGDLLRLTLQQGEALWVGLRDAEATTAIMTMPAATPPPPPSLYGYARRCPLAAPTVDLELGGAALPTGGWAYVATVSVV